MKRFGSYYSVLYMILDNGIFMIKDTDIPIAAYLGVRLVKCLTRL